MMQVLVDSSVWIDHFKQRNAALVALLEAGQVLCHPLVVLAVGLGTPLPRRDVIALLARLETPPIATAAELLALVERRALFGRGCGAVDVSLLAATLLGQEARLWTLDKRLAALADELGCAL